MSFAALLLIAATAPAQEISVKTLLPEMTSFEHLTRRPDPYYTMAQASSYDRASNPGPNTNPFANGDAGQFVRTEQVESRTEYVMADLKGPGAVVRFWSANPAGVVRFYFDGETSPRLQAKTAELLTGKVYPFADPFAYMSSLGTNLYFPLPYAKSLKVTVDNTDNNQARNIYYQFGYRTYTSNTKVKTFSQGDLKENGALMIRTRSLLTTPERTLPTGLIDIKQGPTTVAPGASTSATFQPGGVIRELKVAIPFPLVLNIRAMDWDDPHAPQNVLRTLILSLVVDGKETAAVPLGDFFSTAPGLHALKTFPFEVRSDGTMISRLPIPYRMSLKVTIQNTGQVPVPVTISAKQDRKGPSGGFYTLHARWSVDKGSTRPMRDMTFLDTKGEGFWLGSNLHVANPTPAWWGEGDEKVYVDGETFPSTFGTGTEDYYGYAWCSPEPFLRPYHSQPNAERPGNFGHSDVNRWHVFDPIPFRKSLKFDMEMWHWQDVQAAYYHTAYWYAPPSATPRGPLTKDNLLPLRVEPPKPVAGAIEGEKMRIVSRSGGTTERQGGFWEISAGEQLWWLNPKAGDKLVLSFPVKEAGRYEVFANLCHARDYGIHKMRINGKEVPQMDFFGTGVVWKKLSLGTFDLPAGDSTLEVECVGNRAEAIPSRMFGLDYLLLQKR